MPRLHAVALVLAFSLSLVNPSCRCEDAGEAAPDVQQPGGGDALTPDTGGSEGSPDAATDPGPPDAPGDTGSDPGPADVEEDASADPGTTDTAEDTGVDAGPEDVPEDVVEDTGSDTGTEDVEEDASADPGTTDTAGDTGSDTGPEDVREDVVEDTGSDIGSEDVPEDVVEDTGSDPGPEDVPEDVVEDVVEDTGSDTEAEDVEEDASADPGATDTAEDTATDTGPPPDAEAPTWPGDATMSASELHSDRVTLTWSAATDNVGVTLYRVFKDGTQAGETTELSLTVEGLAPATGYDFAVEASDDAGNWSTGGPTTSVTTPDEAAPAWPQGAKLVATEIHADRVTLSWDAATDDVGVTLYRVFKDGAQAGETTEISLTVEGLSPVTDYDFTVEASDAAGNWSEDGPTTSVTTPDEAPPTWPEGAELVADEVRPESVTLSWSAAEDDVGVTLYRVYLDGVSAGETAELTLTVEGLSPGTRYGLAVEASDAAGNWSTGGPTTSITTPDEAAPTWPGDAELSASDVHADRLTLTWTAAEDDVGVTLYRVFRDGAQAGETAALSLTVEGLSPAVEHEFSVEASDAAGNWSTGGPTLKVTMPDEAAPTWPGDAELTATATHTDSVSLAWSAAGDDVGVTLYRVFKDGAAAGETADLAMTVGGLEPGTEYLFAVEAGDAASNWSANGPTLQVTTPTVDIPPDPGEVAPPVEDVGAGRLLDELAFLVEGDNPVQRGVEPDAIEEKRVALLRGRVLDRAGDPVAGARVTVGEHPELGFTATREDGLFDLVVNGGGRVVVQFRKDGYLPLDRHASPGWQGVTVLEDAVLTDLDPVKTVVDLDAVVGAQAAEGSEVQDDDGVRHPRVLFLEGTEATMTLPDGSEVPLDTITVRATEYTVGEDGFDAMPAALPPASAYTYCVELSVDEALAAGATRVSFSKPVMHYVENFIGFPTGAEVPVGWYDRTDGLWKALDNGWVIEILEEQGDLAVLDTDGDDAADDQARLDELGITEAELRDLASRYAPGDTLWRVSVDHFTPLDCNWGRTCDGGCTPPDGDVDPDIDPDRDCQRGSILDCRNQALGEHLPVAGTGLRLTYSSARVPGFKSAWRRRINLIGSSVPDKLRNVFAVVYVAGREERRSFTPSANLAWTYEWDGLDAYGRDLSGARPMTVRVGYQYPFVYSTSRSGRGFGIVGVRSGGGSAGGGGVVVADPVATRGGGEAATVWRTVEALIGMWEGFDVGLGGWDLDVHHSYDAATGTLYLGDGRVVRARADQTRIVNTVAGTGQHCYPAGRCGEEGRATEIPVGSVQAVAAAPDGTVYFSSMENVLRLRKVDPLGNMTKIGDRTCYDGECCGNCCGDDGPLHQARFDGLTDIEMGPRGHVYIAECGKIRVVDLEGTIRKLTTSPCPTDMAVGSDGSIYVAERCRYRVRHISPDGTKTAFAGTGDSGFSGDGGLALEAELGVVSSVAVAPDGTVYIGDEGNKRVRRVATDGTITTVAGDGTGWGYESGSFALETAIVPRSLAAAMDGSVFVAVNQAEHIVHFTPGGLVKTVMGDDTGFGEGSSADGVPADSALVNAYKMTIAPDGSLLVADNGSERIRRVSAPLPGLGSTDVAIPAPEGHEVYFFDAMGRHLRTLDTRTGETSRTFTYDDAGRLLSSEDGDGNALTVERDDDGAPVAVVGPFGHRTELGLGENGWLDTVRDPAGAETRLDYKESGLLERLEDPEGDVRTFGYDDDGLLTSHDEPGGGHRTLERTKISAAEGSRGGAQVTVTTAGARTTTYRIEQLSSGATREVVTSPAGLVTETLVGTDDTQQLTLPDGTVVTQAWGADPRFGMTAPVLKEMEITTPSGVTSSIQVTRTVTLDDEMNALSLSTLEDRARVNGYTFTQSFDGASRTWTYSTPSYRERTLTLDAQGRVVSVQRPGLPPITARYDGSGRIEELRWDDGVAPALTTMSYGTDGLLSGILQPEDRTTAYARDAAGRVTTWTRPGAVDVILGYDGLSRLSSITLPGRPAHTFKWNHRGSLAEHASPAVGEAPAAKRSLLYDTDHRLSTVTLADGTELVFGYDASAPGPTSLTIPDEVLTLGYDETSGHLDRLETDGGEALSVTWDGVLWTGLTWEGTVAGSYERQHGTGFRVDSTTVNGGHRIYFSWDGELRFYSAGSLTVSHDADTGFIDGTTLHRVKTATTWDAYARPASHNLKYQEEVLFSQAYTRDLLGRITAVDETIEGETLARTFRYDEAGRLAEVTEGGSVVAVYDWDANANRTGVEHGGGAETRIATFDERDRLLSDGETAYTWSETGNLLTRTAGDSVTTYHHDALGRLRGVTLPDGTEVGYVLDPAGRRVGKRVNGTLTRGWLYKDALHPVAELDGEGNVVSRFVYATRRDVPDVIDKGGKSYRVASDSTGSVRLLVDKSSGEVVQRMDYDAFGRVINDTAPGYQPFGFAGGIYDPDTGLVHFGARDYDPETGRFTSGDPAHFMSGSTNLYSYVEGDPVNYTDPSGLTRKGRCKRARRLPRDAWDDPEFEIPGWADTVMGWIGAMSSLLGEYFGWGTRIGSGLMSFAAVLTPATWIVAVEGAQQTGDQLGEVLYTERFEAMDQAIEQQLR